LFKLIFLILHKISPLENALTEIMTLRKFVFLALYTKRPLINMKNVLHTKVLNY